MIITSSISVEEIITQMTAVELVLSQKIIDHRLKDIRANSKEPTIIEIDHIKAGRFINAIKSFRDRTGFDLTFCRDTVDGFRADLFGRCPYCESSLNHDAQCTEVCGGY